MKTEISLNEKGYAVTWDPETGWNLYIPTNEEADELEPTGAALVAVFMRLNSDEEFLNSQLTWLEEQVSVSDKSDEQV